MKTKNIFKYLIVLILALQLGACSSNEAEQKFDQTPTERLNAQKKELQDLVLTSEFGWKAVYFTDNTQLGGYTHLFKFSADGTVQMASDFDSDTDVYKSEYDIQLGSTVSLVFTTKNRIHLLSDSNNFPTDILEGKGYLGDFQFLYYGQENGQIIFKTNRTAQELRFVKATAADWENLSQNIEMEQNVIGAPTRPLFRLLETNDGTTVHQFDFAFTEVTRFAEANSIEAGYSVSYNMGIAYTPTSIIVSPAIEVKDQKLSEFVYDDTNGSFTATGTNGVSAVIKYTDKPLVLTDDYKILLPGKVFARFGYYANDYTEIAPTNSRLFMTELAKIDAVLPAGQRIASVQIYLNHALGNFINYTFVGRPSIRHFVDVVEDPIGKKIILKHKSWSVASPEFLADFDKNLLDTNGIYVKKENFKLNYSNTVYTFTSSSSPFRMTTWQLN